MRTAAIEDTDMLYTKRHYPEFNKTVPLTFYEKTETWCCPLLGPDRMSWNDLHKKIFQHLAREAQLESKNKNDSRLTQV